MELRVKMNLSKVALDRLNGPVLAVWTGVDGCEHAADRKNH
jgi:hypothetical protein